MKLHHCAFMISKGYSEVIQNFCEFLGATLIWEGQDQGREIALRFENNFCIQFSEIDEEPVLSRNKQETHLAFYSKNPKKDISRIESWFNEKKIRTRTGSWSDTELWIDCPSVFVNFVIEIMGTDEKAKV